MAIGNVSFGQQQVTQPNEKKETGVLKGTAIASAAGAGTSSVIGYGVMKGKDALIKNVRHIAVLENELIRNSLGYTSEAKEAIIKNSKKAFTSIKNLRNFNYGKIIKCAGKAALIWGTIYLAYRGIKSLFTSKS